MKKFGYIRVSSKDQNEARQIESMKKLGIDEKNIFIDKQSGKNFDREQYQLLKQIVLRTGGTVVFDSISRMGRNMEQTQEEYKWFVDNGIAMEFIKESMLNTCDAKGDVMKEAVNQIILTVLTAFAQKEREDIKQRQAEGIAVAKAQGKHLGRPKKQGIDDRFIEIYNTWKNGDITAKKAMEVLGVSSATFYRLVKEHEGRE